jgi:hypothetical protein
MRNRIVHRQRLYSAVVATVTATAVLFGATPMTSVAAAGVPATRQAAAVAYTSKAPVYAYYYLWWSRQHWVDMLGPNYPTTATPLPLPATLDSSGCHPVSRYAGNRLTDVPARLYSQDDPGFIENDVREAAAAGLDGFAVNWAGTGYAAQLPGDSVYSRRLASMVAAVHKVNAEGIPFKLWLSYKASAKILPTSAIIGDLSYFVRTYGRDPAFDRSRSAKPTVIWQGSRKYSVAVLQTVNSKFRSSMRIIGDEKVWSSTRAPYLDGDAYYWSSQNPWSNPASFQQLATLAASVRGSGRNADGTAKVWVAPAAPGYNSQLIGGTSCVPRRSGETLRKLMAGNGATSPDAWGFISWNEIAEGTYLDPMTRYGRESLAALSAVVR